MSQSQHVTQPTYMTEQTLFVRSYAKINLTLDVLKKRADGYHELATIMQAIDLFDTICLTRLQEDCVRMVCSRSDLSNEQNLAVRAAQAVRQRLGLKQGLLIELQKRIPVAAGLGGGSSNAATVLLALQQWWKLPLSQEELLEIAASLGSDVPFFLIGGLALCEGRGEILTPLMYTLPSSFRWLLLVKPAISVSTAAVFRSLTARDYSNGEPTQAVLSALANSIEPELSDLYNSLERGVLENYSEVAQASKAMLDAGSPFVRLSGSGPTLFSAFADLAQAAQVQQHLQTQGYEVYLTHPLSALARLDEQ